MMASVTAELGSKASNFWFLFRQCRDLSSKAAFCRFLVASLTAKLVGAIRSTDWHAHVPDKEIFLRLKMADLWFSAPSGELGRYTEVFSGPDCNLHSQGPEQDEAILDVGANIGLFTIRYARMFPTARVYAFEPNPGAYDRLVRNLKANCITNAVAINAAVADSSGTRPFFVGRLTIMGSIIESGDGATEPAFHTEVITLDAFCRAHSITSIGLIKVNVEGAEMEVLKGAQDTLELTRALMIECHSDELAKSVGAFLAARGLDVTFRNILREGLSVIHFARPDANAAHWRKSGIPAAASHA